MKPKQLVGFSVLFTLGIVFSGCQCHALARRLGGVQTVEIPAEQRVMTVQRKEDNLWILTRPMRADETPDTYRYFESSNFGVIEGEVVIRETTP